MEDATQLLLCRKVCVNLGHTESHSADLKWIEDQDSIKLLTEETARCFDHEKVRMLYIAAQIARIDLKVDLAVTKTMQIYKRILKSASSVSMLPLGSTTHRVTVAVVVCKAVVNAFGVPSVTAATRGLSGGPAPSWAAWRRSSSSARSSTWRGWSARSG